MCHDVLVVRGLASRLRLKLSVLYIILAHYARRQGAGISSEIETWTRTGYSLVAAHGRQGAGISSEIETIRSLYTTPTMGQVVRGLASRLRLKLRNLA